MKEIVIIILIALFSLGLIFHLLVMVKIIPYTIVWGGRMKSDKDMYRFETVSLILNTVFLFIILIQAQLIDLHLPDMVLTILLWIMAALFALNTIGNLLSKNKLEKRIFTPLTFLVTALTIMLILVS